MADVQLEKGYFRIANRLDEAVTCADFTLTQLKIVRSLIRLTYGWRQRTATVSVGYIAERCGLQDSGGLRRDFRELLVAGVILEIEKAHGRTPSTYAVNKNFERWGKFSLSISKLEALFSERPPSIDSQTPPSQPTKPEPSDEFDDSETGSPPPSSQSTDPVDSPNGASQTPTSENARVTPWSRKGDSTEPQLSRNSLFDETLKRGKTGKTVVYTASNPLPPSNLLRDTAAVAGGDDRGDDRHDGPDQEPDARLAKRIEQFAIGMSTAANAAITAKFGEQPNPVTFVTGLETARLLIEKGVSLETARSAIAGVIAKSKADRPPQVLSYFYEPILRGHASGVQRGLNAADPSVPRSPAESGPQSLGAMLPYVDGVKALREREERIAAEYDIARQEAAQAWSSDQANVAEFRGLVAAANAKYEGFLDRQVIQRARDTLVIQGCAERCGFPSYETWLAEREHAPPEQPRPPDAAGSSSA